MFSPAPVKTTGGEMNIEVVVVTAVASTTVAMVTGMIEGTVMIIETTDMVAGIGNY